MSAFEEMRRALKEGKVVALIKNEENGEIKLGGVFNDDREITLTFICDSPAEMAAMSEFVLIKGIYRPTLVEPI